MSDKQAQEIEALRAKIAALEAVSKHVQGGESKEDREKAQVRAAFQHYDADSSGSIDAQEFTALVLDLGVTFADDKEEAKALTAIDTSSDGQIQFDEFYAWWTSEDREGTKGTAAQLALLKAKLRAKYLKQKSKDVARALTKTDAEGFLQEVDIGLELGGEFEAGTSLEVGLRYDEKDSRPKWYKDQNYVVELKFAANTETSGEDRIEARAELRGVLKVLVSMIPLPGKVTVDVVDNKDDDTTSILLTLDELITQRNDPFHFMEKLQLDPRQFVDHISLAIKLLPAINKIVTAHEDLEEKTPASLAKASVNVSGAISRKLYEVLAQQGAAPKGFALVALLKELKFNLKFGDLEELLTAFCPNHEQRQLIVNNMHQYQSLMPNAMMGDHVRQFMLTAPGVLAFAQQGFMSAQQFGVHIMTAGLRGDAGESASQKAQDLWGMLTKLVSGLAGIHAYHSSGVHVSVDHKGILDDFSHFEELINAGLSAFYMQLESLR